MKTNKKTKELTLTMALVGFFAPLLIMLTMLFMKIDIKLALTVGIAIEAGYGILLGYPWEEIEESAMKGIGRVNQTVIIMMLIGMLIGVWLSAGCIQTMLYYGINIIRPSLFLPICFALCIITSLCTGTSWGTAGTMGIALIGVADGLGIPIAMAAGAVISGALVGDKLSPLSDTTLLASAVTEVNLYDHIVSLMYVTVPVSIISFIIYTLIGLKYGSTTASLESIQILSNSLKQSTNINLLMLVPLLLVLILSARRKPCIPVFAVGIVTGIVWALIFQKQSLSSIATSAITGYVSATGNISLDKLLSRGGLMSMADTIFLCIGAGTFSGIFEQTKVLAKIMETLTQIVKTVGGMVFSVTATGTLLMFGGAGQSCTLTLPAIAFKDAFDNFGVHRCVLSRSLECTGTVLGALVPWDASAILYTSLFGVSVLEYLPFNYISTLAPIGAIVTAYIGYGVFKKGERVSLNKIFKLRRKNGGYCN